MLVAIAFAGKSNTPNSRHAFMVREPLGVSMGNPLVFRWLIFSRTGERMVDIDGLHGPCHIPARMRFSASIRMLGGRLVTASNMGQIECFADLKSCTPSAHKIRQVCSGTERKPPGVDRFSYSLPP